MKTQTWKPDKVHFLLGFVLVATVCSIWLILDKKAGKQEASIIDGNIADLENRIDRLETGQVALRQNMDKKIKHLIADINKNIEVTSPVPAFSDDYPQKGFVHKVEKGETVSSIAQKYNSREKWIRDANLIVDPTNLFEGKDLFIPIETPGRSRFEQYRLIKPNDERANPKKLLFEKVNSFCDEILKIDERLQEVPSSQFSSQAPKILGTAESLAKEFYPSIELDYQDLTRNLNEFIIKFEDKAIDPNISHKQRSRYDQLADRYKEIRMSHIEATKALKRTKEDWEYTYDLLRADHGQKQILDSWEIFTNNFQDLVHFDYDIPTSP